MRCPLKDRLDYAFSVCQFASLVLCISFTVYVRRALLEALESNLHHYNQHYTQTQHEEWQFCGACFSDIHV
jgi:hypothetical protein